MTVVPDQPAPRANTGPAVWDLVVADMRERDETGLRRYGTRLQPLNGRDALVDAYQEALDLAVYLRQAIYERDVVRGPVIESPAICDQRNTVEHFYRHCGLARDHAGWHVDGVFTWYIPERGPISWAIMTEGQQR